MRFRPEPNWNRILNRIFLIRFHSVQNSGTELSIYQTTLYNNSVPFGSFSLNRICAFGSFGSPPYVIGGKELNTGTETETKHNNNFSLHTWLAM